MNIFQHKYGNIFWKNNFCLSQSLIKCDSKTFPEGSICTVSAIGYMLTVMVCYLEVVHKIQMGEIFTKSEFSKKHNAIAGVCSHRNCIVKRLTSPPLLTGKLQCHCISVKPSNIWLASVSAKMLKNPLHSIFLMLMPTQPPHPPLCFFTCQPLTPTLFCYSFVTCPKEKQAFSLHECLDPFGFFCSSFSFSCFFSLFFSSLASLYFQTGGSR